MTDGLLIVGGLVVGADVLVRAGSGLAAWLGIGPIIIGLTVVSLGTSVPELAVGIGAAVGGNPERAVGSNAVRSGLASDERREQPMPTSKRSTGSAPKLLSGGNPQIPK